MIVVRVCCGAGLPSDVALEGDSKRCAPRSAILLRGNAVWLSAALSAHSLTLALTCASVAVRETPCCVLAPLLGDAGAEWTTLLNPRRRSLTGLATVAGDVRTAAEVVAAAVCAGKPREARPDEADARRLSVAALCISPVSLLASIWMS